MIESIDSRSPCCSPRCIRVTTGADIDTGGLERMVSQCKLTIREFHDLVEHPVSRAAADNVCATWKTYSRQTNRSVA